MHILQAGVFAFLVTVIFLLVGVNNTRSLLAIYFGSAALWLAFVILRKKTTKP
jgi:hypothetical protein